MELNKLEIVHLPLAPVVMMVRFLQYILMLIELNKDIHKYLKYNDWYLWSHKDTGKISMPIFQSLEAFWPGVQVG